MKGKKSGRPQNKGNQAGFTLVELLVTMALLSILLAITVVGILAWRDWADFKRQNEYAQSLYTAMQTQLTDESVNGQLGDLTEQIEDAYENRNAGVVRIDLSSITTEAGEPAESDKVWNHSEKSVIYGITLTKEQYQLYLDEKDRLPEVVTAIYDRLDKYLYDKSILDATIAVELDPTEGLVYSILYSDKNKISGFEYKKSNNNTSGVVNITDRQESFRRDRMIGYYGVDTLSKATTTKTEKPEISSLKLNDEETLNLTWNMKKVPQSVGILTYEVVIYDPKDKTKPLVEITFNNLSEDEKDKSKTGALNEWNEAEWNNTLTAADGSSLNQKTIGALVVCHKYEGDTDTKVTSYQNMAAWINSTGQVELVLDAVDLAATAEVYTAAKASLNPADSASSTLRETFSALRMLQSNQNICCTVRGSAPIYKNTAAKQSNTENMLFASETESKTTETINGVAQTVITHQYEIKNARHLYNIRYIETKEAQRTEKNQYNLTKDFAWSGADSMLSKEAVYLGQQSKTVLEEEGEIADYSKLAFPQIKQLGLYSVLQSKSTNYEIKGLILSYDATNYVVSEKRGAGLFFLNAGVIQNISLSNVKVDGTGSVKIAGEKKKTDATGSFCAFNSGKLKNLKVLSGTVTGSDHVGGVFGNMVQPSVTITSTPETSGGFLGWLEEVINQWLQDLCRYFFPDADPNSNQITLNVTYEKLVNYAEVSGENSVGGITSEISAVVRKERKGKLDELKRKSDIEKAAKDTSDDVVYWVTEVVLEDCENYGLVYGSGEKIGGIIGSDSNMTFDILATSVDDVESIILKECISSPAFDNLEQTKEIYESKIGSKYVYESKYVGGIVGLHTLGKLDKCTTSSKKTGYVVGGSYVGGIVGIQTVGVDSNGTALNNKQIGCFSSSSDVINRNHVLGSSYVGGIIGYNDGILNNCTNSGIVAATSHVSDDPDISTSQYVGGITGFNSNTGVIDGCTVNMNYDETTKEIFEYTGNQSDYAGGVTGYNDGTIKTSPTDVLPDKTTKINAVINGKNFVGGVAGYNASKAGISGYEINGGTIVGINFVGGYIGLNTSVDFLDQKTVKSDPNEVKGSYAVGGILGGNIVDTNKEITTYFYTNNFLGTISADAYAGGFVGYNLVYPMNAVSNPSYSKDADAYAKDILSVFENSAYTLQKEGEAYTTEQKAERIFACTQTLENCYDYRKGSQTADKRAGLVITHASGESSAVSKFGSVNACMYAGGVVGYNDSNNRLTVDSIANNTPVTTTGKISEKQSGGSKLYNTVTTEEKFYSYAGGIIGYVAENTTVQSCRNEDEGSVTSEGTYTGGLCEVNDGTIKDCITNNLGNSADDFMGGLVGLNTTKGIITNCEFIDNTTMMGRNYVGGFSSENMGRIEHSHIDGGNVTIQGNYAGGISGVNAGTILLDADQEQTIYIAGSGTYVGGLVGLNQGTIAASGGDTITISAKSNICGSSAVGGAVGLLGAQNTVRGIVNRAAVTATDGNAGGIAGAALELAASNQAALTIENCKNSGAILTSRSGDAGGIIAELPVYAVIRGCNNQAQITAGKGNAGGITASNSGTIENCTVSGKKDAEVQIAAYEAAGGISGVTKGTIRDSSVSYIQVKNDVSSTTLCAGGVAGINLKEGQIVWSTNDYQMVDHAAITAVNKGAFCGGIAGRNEGSIQGETDTLKTVLSDVTLGFSGLGSYANLGGVAGENQGRISGCDVTGVVQGSLGHEAFGYGGIAGISGSDETDMEVSVNDCSFNGTVTGNGSATAITNIGGIVGKNYKTSTISNCAVGTKVSTSITSGDDSNTRAFAYLGGMIGWNQGIIENCDNAEKSADTAVNITGYAGHCGGIVGYEDDTAVIRGTQAEDGRITYTSTGKNWTVSTNYYSNDGGAGGIMGYCASGENLSYLVNYASVTSSYKLASTNNTTVGGIVGRLENKNKLNMQMTNCSNYGALSGKDITGGLIGRMKFQGITAEKCQNFGEIKNGIQVGGIIGSIYMVTSGEKTVRVMECENGGAINGTGGGIVGVADASNGVRIVISDCVNTGVLSTNVNGILGKSPERSASLYRCRNYGIGSENASGIAAGKVAVMKDCFVFSNPKTIFADNIGKSNTGDNYYVEKTSQSSNTNTCTETNQLVSMPVAGAARQYRLCGQDAASQIASALTGIQPDPMGAGRDGLSYYTDKSAYQDYQSFSNALSYRYQLIAQIEPKLMDYYKSKYSESITLTSLTATNIGGAYRLEWGLEDPNKEAYAYELSYTVSNPTTDEVIDSGSTEIVDRKVAIDIKSEWYGMKLNCSVRSVYWSKVGNQFVKQYGTPCSLESSIQVEQPLPTPVVHLELITSNASGQKDFMAVLENYKDYAGRTCTIKVNTDKARISFVADGVNRYSDTFSLGNDAGNQLVTVQAVGNESYGDSPSQSTQTYVISASRLKDTRYAQTNFSGNENGFFGITPDELYYELGMKGNGNIEAFYQTELSYEDASLGLMVSAGSGEAHVTQSQTVKAILEQIPEELFQTDGTMFEVRTYPWRTQGDVIYYGHEVTKEDGSFFTREELAVENRASIRDEEMEHFGKDSSVFDASGKLKSGYVIQKQSDDRYRILYSSILSNEISMQVEEQQFAVRKVDGTMQVFDTMKTQDITDDELVGVVQQTPEISATAETTVVDGKSGYKFTWDEVSGSVYDVTLYGILENNEKVTIENRTGITDNSVFFDDASWNFVDVELKVTRCGITDVNGKTTVFGASSSREYNIKMRLSNIAAPVLMLSDKSGLIYDISWTAVAEREMTGLNYYEVTVTGTAIDATPLTRTFTTARAYQDDGTPTGNQVEPEIRAADLSEFAAGSAIIVSVKAVADSHSAIYRDSSAGVVRSITIPGRLKAPEMGAAESTEGLTLSRVYSDSQFVSAEQFRNELTFTMTDASAAYNGYYEISYEIYDGPCSEENLASDTPPTRLEVLKEKLNPAVMTGDLRNGTYTISDLSTDYAGKYIRVVMRSVSSNSVSSVWTDEAFGSINEVSASKCFRLPRVQIEDTGLTEGVEDQSYYLTINGVTDSENPSSISVKQKSLAFQTKDYTGDYCIWIGQSMESADVSANTFQKKGSYLRIHKNDASGKWEIYCVKTDEDVPRMQQEDPLHPYTGDYESTEITENYHPEYGTLIGLIDQTGDGQKILELPYQTTYKEYKTDLTPTGYALTLKAYLKLSYEENASAGWTLVLPDTDQLRLSDIEYTIVENVETTQRVVVRAEAANEENYADSVVENWYRTKNETDEHITKIQILEILTTPVPEFTYQHATDGSDTPDTPVAIPELTDITAVNNYYAISITSTEKYWYQYEVCIYDTGADGEEVQEKVFYQSGACKDESSQVTSGLHIPAQYHGKKAVIRAQATIGEDQFSEWSAPFTVKLGG